MPKGLKTFENHKEITNLPSNLHAYADVHKKSEKPHVREKAWVKRISHPAFEYRDAFRSVFFNLLLRAAVTSEHAPKGRLDAESLEGYYSQKLNDLKTFGDLRDEHGSYEEGLKDLTDEQLIQLAYVAGCMKFAGDADFHARNVAVYQPLGEALKRIAIFDFDRCGYYTNLTDEDLTTPVDFPSIKHELKDVDLHAIRSELKIDINDRHGPKLWVNIVAGCDEGRHRRVLPDNWHFSEPLMTRMNSEPLKTKMKEAQFLGFSTLLALPPSWQFVTKDHYIPEDKGGFVNHLQTGFLNRQLEMASYLNSCADYRIYLDTHLEELKTHIQHVVELHNADYKGKEKHGHLLLSAGSCMSNLDAVMLLARKGVVGLEVQWPLEQQKNEIEKISSVFDAANPSERQFITDLVHSYCKNLDEVDCLAPRTDSSLIALKAKIFGLVSSGGSTLPMMKAHDGCATESKSDDLSPK